MSYGENYRQEQSATYGAQAAGNGDLDSTARFDRERGRDPGLYYLRVFGEPGGA